MGSVKILKQILSSFVPCPRLFVFNNVESSLVCGILDNAIYIHRVSPILDFDSDKKQTSSHEILYHTHRIVGLFLHENITFCIDKEGNLSTLSQGASGESNIECDLFEDSPGKAELWVLRVKKELLSDSDYCVLCYCKLFGELALLVNSSADLYLKIFNLDTGQQVKSLSLRSPGLSSDQNKCSLWWREGGLVEEEFLKSWFPEVPFPAKTGGLLLVALPEGNIFTVFPQSDLVEHLYSWPFPLTLARWDHSIHSESGVAETRLNLLFEGGTLARLDQYGGVLTRFLPLTNLASALLLDNILFISDQTDSYRLNLVEEKNAIILPLKGVVSWTRTEAGRPLALTLHGALYSLSVAELATPLPPDPPSSELALRLSSSASHLDALGRQLVQADLYISAASLALKKLNLKMTGQIVAITGLLHTVMVYAECATRDAVFQAGIWTVSVCLASSKCRLSVCRELSTDLNSSSPFRQIFSFEMPPFSRPPLHISVSLICCLGQGRYRPFVHLGQMELDGSHMLQPPEHLAVVRSALSTEVDWEEVLRDEGVVGAVPRPSRRTEEELTVSLKVDKGLVGPQGLFSALLSNSRALWRTTAWTEACKPETTQLEVVLGGHLVRLNLEGEDRLHIHSKDLYVCHLMKSAVLGLLYRGRGKEVHAKPTDLLSTVEDLSQSVELLMYKEEGDVSKLSQLHRQLREQVTSHLTG